MNVFSAHKHPIFAWRLVLAAVVTLASSSVAFAAQPVVEKTCSAIQRAINRLPATGGEVLLTTGTYVCTHPIVMDKNNVSLRGKGSATILKLADGINAPVIVMGTTENIPTRTIQFISVSHLSIDGNRANQTAECMGGPCSDQFPLRNNGISLRRCVDCKVESVVTFAAKSGGLVTELGCRRLRIIDFTSFDNEFDGFAGYETEDSSFIGLYLHNNQAAGISTDIKFNNNRFTDVTVNNNKSVGIFMRDSLNNSFVNLHVSDSGQHGIFLAQVNDEIHTAATGNTFTGVHISRSGGAGFAVNDASCVDNMLVGAQLFQNRQSCIYEAASGLVENLGTICR